MQTLLLACYICLQLINLPNDLTLNDLLKRDTSCDQCLTGLFDSSELIPSLEKQTPGELLLSNPALKETLEERLINKLPKRYLQSRVEPQETVKDVIVKEEQVNKVNMMVEDMLKATDTAIKIMQEKAVEMMKMNLNKMLLQLEERQMQLLSELELATNRQLNRQLEMADKNEEPVIEESQPQEVKVPQRNMLKNKEKLLVGESLVSENGRFKATMENSGLVIITDRMKDDRVIKKFGDQRSDNPESELYLMVKPNGNLVIKDGKMSIWHCGGPSPKRGNSHFVKLDNDGQMVVYNAWNYRVWTSGFPELDNKKGIKQEETFIPQVSEVLEGQLKELETLMQTVQDIFDNEVKSIRLQEEYRNLQDYHIQDLIARKREKLRGDLGIIRNTIEAKSNHKNILGNDVLFLAGSSLVSENGEYKATMMRSGELIITDSTKKIVARIGRSMSDETDASHYIYQQADGNLVVYNIRTIIPTWHSGTYTPDSKAGSQYYLKLENNGELVMYGGNNQRIWTSIDSNIEREQW